MKDGKRNVYSLVFVSLFITLTGISALFKGRAVADPHPPLTSAAVEPALAVGPGPMETPAASPAPEPSASATTPSSLPEPSPVPAPKARGTVSAPTGPSLSEPPAPHPPTVTVGSVQRRTPGYVGSVGSGETRSSPLPASVTPPRDPRPSAYRPHPGLWEREVNNPRRTERPRPLRAMLTPAERELLAHLIHAEAAGEPYEGKVAVAAVILNRLAHPSFPNTVEGVVFERRAFEPVRNGRLWRGSTPQDYQALDDALRGHDPTNGALYFYNPNLVSPDNWIRTRQVVRVIGRHNFAI